MNTVRRSLSQIKSGRLAKYLGSAQALNLLISDVPKDDPAVIGSGLLTPSALNVDWDGYPQEVCEALKAVSLPPLASVNDCKHIETHIIAKLDDAKDAVARSAQDLGYTVSAQPEFLSDNCARSW